MINTVDLFEYNGNRLEYKASALILEAEITADCITNTVSEMNCLMLDGAKLKDNLMYWCRTVVDNAIVFGSIYNIKYDDYDDRIFDCKFVDGVGKASVDLAQFSGEYNATNAKFTNLLDELNSNISDGKAFFGKVNAPIKFIGSIRDVNLRFLFEGKVEKKTNPIDGEPDIETIYPIGVLTLDEIINQLVITYSLLPRIKLTEDMIFEVSFDEVGYGKNYRKMDISTYPIVSYSKTQEYYGYGQAIIGQIFSGIQIAFKVDLDGIVWKYDGYDPDDGMSIAKNIETGETVKGFESIESNNINTLSEIKMKDDFKGAVDDILRKLRDSWAGHNIKVLIDSEDVGYFVSEIGQSYILYEETKPIFTKLTAVTKKTNSLLELTFGYTRPKLSDQIRDLKDGYAWKK